MKKIRINANAKINLFLEVGARRPDGYHDIESVMQSVTLSDTVTVMAGDGAESGIRLECGALPTDERNIAYRAAALFCAEAGIEPRVSVVVEKNIPVAAGLAGGSTDGAAVLRALNLIYGGVLDSARLVRIAARIGADVPFCLIGGTMLAGGIGDVLSPCHEMPDCHILIIKRSEGVLTPEAFRELDRSREGVRYTGRSAERMLAALRTGDISEIGNELYNAFGTLPYASRLGADVIAATCRDHGGYPLLSGSGPSVFALFADEKDAAAAEVAVRAAYHDATVCLCRPARKMTMDII